MATSRIFQLKDEILGPTISTFSGMFEIDGSFPHLSAER
jgi:hypothetical protein